LDSTTVSNKQRTAPMKPANLSFKSIYGQTVQVSLEHLYKGVEKYKFDLVDNLWTHWRAAIRGKVVYLSLYHGLIYALPLSRAREFVAFCTGVVIVHATLPKPDPEQRFESALPKGSNGARPKSSLRLRSSVSPNSFLKFRKRLMNTITCKHQFGLPNRKH
jgi:hypothetical protein